MFQMCLRPSKISRRQKYCSSSAYQTNRRTFTRSSATIWKLSQGSSSSKRLVWSVLRGNRAQIGESTNSKSQYCLSQSIRAILQFLMPFETLRIFTATDNLLLNCHNSCSRARHSRETMHHRRFTDNLSRARAKPLTTIQLPIGGDLWSKISCLLPPAEMMEQAMIANKIYTAC